MNTEKYSRIVKAPYLVAILTFAIFGCGQEDDAPETTTVSGTVTYEGTPISDGDIVLRPAEGEGRSDAGKIKDGKFSFPATLGKKKVEITARRETGEFDTSNPGEKTPITEQYLPETYNTKSTLTAEVTKNGPIELKFELNEDGT